ncbi:MAG: CopG family transcriptional regulator [Candidatus Gracilibacteria bacterium]
MKPTITFTSTLPANLMSWLTKQAEKENTTKRAVIEQALKIYQDETKREELEETFKRASKDKDMLEMAEEGMDDYYEQLN